MDITKCDPIFNTLNKIAKREKAKCFSTYDFKTLYTKLPHNKLLDVLIQLIDFVFQWGNKTLINVRAKGFLGY